MVGRAIRNRFIKNSEEGKKHKFNCTWKCLATCKANDANYCISVALNNARLGKIDKGFVFAGSNAYRIKEIVSVKSLVTELRNEYLKESRLVNIRNLKPVIAKLNTLYNKYQDKLQIELACKKAYEKALTTYNDKLIAELRKQYKKAKANTLNVQLLLEEKLTFAWKAIV